VKPWATTGKTKDRERNILTSLHIQPEKMEEVNLHLQKKYRTIVDNEVRYESVHADDADYLVVAYGLVARIAHKAVELARAEGIKVGLLRPKTLFPFPTLALRDLAETVNGMLVVEMNAGQMVEDVRLAVEGKVPVEFYGRMGGIIPSPEEIVKALEKLVKREAAVEPDILNGVPIAFQIGTE
jgi:2-oxoglutarate ferredoxin oxidoreductase subunit alpha